MTLSPDPFDLPALLQEIEANGKKLGEGRAQTRQQCLAAARSLCYALETPIESILRTHWAEQAHHAALRTANGLHLFDKWEEAGSGIKSNSELSELTGADPSLLARILKHLAAMGTIYETGPDQYSPTAVSKALAKQVHRDAFLACFDLAGPPFRRLHEHLAITGYRTPHNLSNGPFQYAHQTPDDFWGMLSKHPDMGVAFGNHMVGLNSERLSWMDRGLYPVEENLANGVNGNEDAVLLVDIGGGTGQNIQEFRRKYPSLHGQLVLQDKPEVIKVATGLDQSIKAMAYDFFTEQPVKGARAYYMRSILHDWPDEKCVEILANLKPAMTPKYSKLLINEYVIPDTGAHWISTALDMLMMATFSSRERSEQNWRRILEGVGFRIIKIWCPEPGAESLIEAELAAEATEPGVPSLGEACVATEAPNGIASKSENEDLVERSDIVATESDTGGLSESHTTAHVTPGAAIEPGMASTINADIPSPGSAIIVPEAGFEGSTKTDLLPEQPQLVVN